MRHATLSSLDESIFVSSSINVSITLKFLCTPLVYIRVFNSITRENVVAKETTRTRRSRSLFIKIGHTTNIFQGKKSCSFSRTLKHFILKFILLIPSAWTLFTLQYFSSLFYSSTDQNITITLIYTKLVWNNFTKKTI